MQNAVSFSCERLSEFLQLIGHSAHLAFWDDASKTEKTVIATHVAATACGDVRN